MAAHRRRPRALPVTVAILALLAAATGAGYGLGWQMLLRPQAHPVAPPPSGEEIAREVLGVSYRDPGSHQVASVSRSRYSEKCHATNHGEGTPLSFCAG